MNIVWKRFMPGNLTRLLMVAKAKKRMKRPLVFGIRGAIRPCNRRV